MSNAENVGQMKRLDHCADVFGKIPEVIPVHCRLVSLAMAAAVERIDGVGVCEFAGHLIPDLGDEAGAVHQKRRRSVRIVCTPSGESDGLAGGSDRNSMGAVQVGSVSPGGWGIIGGPFL